MNKLADFYEARVAHTAPDDLLSQVGHTEGGHPIDAKQLAYITGRIAELLDLRPDDRLLDLCCGNGAITRCLAPRAGSITAIDLTPALIATARCHAAAANISYDVGDALTYGLAERPPGDHFDKVLVYAALQHFRKSQLNDLIDSISGCTRSGACVVLGFVPERSRRGTFFKTPRQKATYLLRLLFGRDHIGTWWRRRDIARVCRARGIACSFHEIAPVLRAANHRFDIVLRLP
ncbi:methyltransferase family protein [Breoghania corrubedonensis]|uniref:Methyltransferase family protein n=1 Tax=Breoghania corrubedonensis TaxID=665038 RepID=A0A2T5UW65_9HYPH|nr:class I SAM-dependent methyltransferase [Breoghania corrubedonensis]PTW55740.1 methyltransferase family protein [Breoghania corrubedonensis]